jgi:uncharacterized membrane protein
MARFEHSVVISRPLEDVFAFAANPVNDPQWSSAVDVTQVSAGPLVIGTEFQQVGRFLGRRVELSLQVTAYDPNQRLRLKTTSGPIRFAGTRRFEPVTGGTRVTFTGDGETGGFFKLVEPLVIPMARRQLRVDLANLKRVVEM